MLSRLAITLGLLLAGFSNGAFASYQQGLCEARLLAEFSSPPNDRQLGKITGRVPITPEYLTVAYEKGIFPWFIDDDGKPFWASPPQRGIFLLKDLHISRTDRQFIDKALADPAYEVTFDKAFREVIEGCADMIRWRRMENGDRLPDGKWITPEYVENYTLLFERGLAHSVEVWHNGILVGGLYGTFVKGVYAGESMFHLEDNVNKIAYFKLLERLEANGHWMIDTQQSMNLPDMEDEEAPRRDALPQTATVSRSLADKWGAKPVSRKKFETLLKQAQSANLPF